MKKVVIASVLALAASGTLVTVPALAQSTPDSSSGSITMKPAEYNAYNNAISQTSPAAEAAAIEQFLKDYPGSPVENSLLAKLVEAYRSTGDIPKTLDAAKRLLKVEPTNIRILAFVAYVEKSQSTNDPSMLTDAATYAQQGLNLPKPADMTDAQYASVKEVFEDVIANSDLAKKDYTNAIAAFEAELKAYPTPDETTKGFAIVDTYNLGNAYVQQNPKDLVHAIWYFTRAALYLPAPYNATAQKAAEYWYQQYHGSMDGYPAIQAQAKTNIFPPASFTITPAPPPPSKADLAHQAVMSTPNLNSLSLHDKEYILANGNATDAGKVWDVLKGKIAEVPGVVISATPDAVQLAVSPDAQNSHEADFTVNMKKPLHVLPVAGQTVSYIATFGSYTQSPFMIILTDGFPKVAAPVVHHRR